MENKKLWFKAKRFGWGWYPITWQGWAISFVYIIVLITSATNIDKNSHSISDTLIKFSVPFIVSTIILLAICYKKGEKPKWSWGKEE